MPNPVSRTAPVARFTRILAGLMSLWTRPCRWTLPSAAAMPIARRRTLPTSMGAPRCAQAARRPDLRAPASSGRARAQAPEAAPPTRRPAHPSIRIRGRGARGWRVAGAPRRAARPARRGGCRRRPGAIPGRRRARRPPTRPGGRRLPQCRIERMGPIAALRRQGDSGHRTQQATRFPQIGHDQLEPEAGQRQACITVPIPEPPVSGL